MVSRYYSFYYIDLCISICFWTLFKNVHCRGPCSLRPCITRPYCISQSIKSSICNKNDAKETRYVPYTLEVEYASLYHKKKWGWKCYFSQSRSPICYYDQYAVLLRRRWVSATRKVHTYLGNYGSILLSKWVQLECFTIDTAIGR